MLCLSGGSSLLLCTRASWALIGLCRLKDGKSRRPRYCRRMCVELKLKALLPHPTVLTVSSVHLLGTVSASMRRACVVQHYSRPPLCTVLHTAVFPFACTAQHPPPPHVHVTHRVSFPCAGVVGLTVDCLPATVLPASITHSHCTSFAVGCIARRFKVPTGRQALVAVRSRSKSELKVSS